MDLTGPYRTVWAPSMAVQPMIMCIMKVSLESCDQVNHRNNWLYLWGGGGGVGGRWKRPRFRGVNACCGRCGREETDISQRGFCKSNMSNFNKIAQYSMCAVVLLFHLAFDNSSHTWTGGSMHS